MELLGKIRQFIQADWKLLLPVVLGFLAVYWLLPRARRDWLISGALAGAAAIICAGWSLVHWEIALIEQVLFYAFSGIAILGGGLMLAQNNPVRAALSFALVVLSSCGLFLLLAAPFLMAATIIIYGGAIIITFLFVVMLAQQGGLTSADQRSREPFLACLAGFVLLACLLVVLHKNYDTGPIDTLLETPMTEKPAMKKVQAVASAATPEEIIGILGAPKIPGSLPLVEELKKLLEESKTELPSFHEDSIMNMETQWVHLTDSRAEVRLNALKELQSLCRNLLAEVQSKVADIHRARFGQGSLQLGAKLPLSPFSGVPANQPFPTEPTHRLSARNVEALGLSLFTDYLVAVEVAGVLLLVATIGAIVIAGSSGPRTAPRGPSAAVGGNSR